MRKLLASLLLFASVGLGACAVKSDVPLSSIPLPPSAPAATAMGADEQEWWRHFDDDVLTKRGRIPFEKLTTPDALKKLKDAVAWVIEQVNVECAKAVS